MIKKIGISIFTIIFLFTQVGCTSTRSINSKESVIQSETKTKIIKDTILVGVLGGATILIALDQILGGNLTYLAQSAITAGIILTTKFASEKQIATLNDETLKNDKKDISLTKSKKVNTDGAKLNLNLKMSIKKQQGLFSELTKAKNNQEQVKRVIENRKYLLDTLVKNSSQYKELAKEVKILENENVIWESIIKQLENIEVGGI